MVRIESERRSTIKQLVGLWIVGLTLLFIPPIRALFARPRPPLTTLLRPGWASGGVLFVLLLFFTIDIVRNLDPSRRPRIVFDPDRRLIVFERCRVARSFLSFGRVERLECPFSDILDIRERTGRSRAVKVVTAHGTVEIGSDFSDFRELREQLLELRQDTPGGPISESYEFPLLVGVGITALIFAILVLLGWV